MREFLIYGQNVYVVFSWMCFVCVTILSSTVQSDWTSKPAGNETACNGTDFILGWIYVGTSRSVNFYKDNVRMAFSFNSVADPAVLPDFVGKIEFIGDTQAGNATIKIVSPVPADSGVYTTSVTVVETGLPSTGTSTVLVTTAPPVGLEVTGTGQNRNCQLTSAGDPAVELYWKKDSDNATIAGPTASLTLSAPANLNGQFSCCMTGRSVKCYSGATTEEFCISVDIGPGITTTSQPTGSVMSSGPVETTSPGNDGLSDGILAAIIVVSIGGVIVISGVALYCYMRHKNQRRPDPAPKTDEKDDTLSPDNNQKKKIIPLERL